MAAADEVFMLNELSAIKDQLKCQLLGLGERERTMKEREAAVAQRETAVGTEIMRLKTREKALTQRETLLLEIEEYVTACYSSIEDCIDREIQESVESSVKLETAYQYLLKENTRLKEGFKAVCSMNEKLKNQLEAEAMKSSHTKKQLISVQGRLSSLKRSQSAQCKQEQEYSSGSQAHKEPRHEDIEQVAEERIIENEVSENEVWQGLLLHNFIQWVSNALPAIADDRTSPDDLCMETFPLVALLLPKAPVQQHYVYLKFICQAVLHLSSKTKIQLATSLRRIGEVCVSSFSGNHGLKSARIKGCFCGSPDVRIRTLSSLVILHSITRVDAVSQALQNLKHDLMEQCAQNEFLSFGGIRALLPYVKPSTKFQVLCMACLDIFILLSSEAGFEHFLNKEWFATAAEMIRQEFIQPQQLEKLSILLQRLSTFRYSKVLFEGSEVQQLLQSLSTTKLTSFLQLNITSTLANLKDSY